MTSTSAEFTALKARLKATWMAGDFGQIAQYSEAAAEQFIARCAITPGMRVLDVACGTGNLAIPAAKAGAIVTGVDIAPNLLEQARARAQHASGHVVVNSTVDRPWSQYFCCMLAGNRECVRTHPVATKRALRAILKAANVCELEPEQAAQFIVDKGFTPRYDYALQAIKDLPYGQWREHSAEDTMRFYALRLYEVGMLKSSPQKLIAQGTDWRFFNELKKELKG